MQDKGDGNGIIEGMYSNSAGSNVGYLPFEGEEAMFWVDLSKAGMIDGTFSTATSTAIIHPNITTQAGVQQYFPQAKTGSGAYVYVWSGGYAGHLIVVTVIIILLLQK